MQPKTKQKEFEKRPARWVRGLENVLCSLMCLMVSMIPGCGGGERGTGIAPFEGRLTRNGIPPEAGIISTVSTLDSDGEITAVESAATDAEGRFTVSIPNEGIQEIVVEFSAPGLDAAVSVQDVPVQFSDIRAEFNIIDADSVVIVDVVFGSDAPEPPPAAPAPTSQPPDGASEPPTDPGPVGTPALTPSMTPTPTPASPPSLPVFLSCGLDDPIQEIINATNSDPSIISYTIKELSRSPDTTCDALIQASGRSDCQMAVTFFNTFPLSSMNAAQRALVCEGTLSVTTVENDGTSLERTVQKRGDWV